MGIRPFGKAHPCALLLAILLLFAHPPASATEISATEARYNQLHALTRDRTPRTDSETAALLEHAYLRLFPSPATHNQLHALSNGDLGFVLRAADTAVFYTFNPAYLHDMQTMLAELEHRGAATDPQRINLYQATIGLRDFEAARHIAQDHPALPVDPVPMIAAAVDSGDASPLAYRLASDPTSLHEIRLDIHQGTHLIVIAHPLCAFSRRAMLDLQADPVLAPILAQHALWLAPVDRRLYLDILGNWNHEHPDMQMMLARHRADWPMLDAWATPNFYLLRDGRVIGKFSGWPKEGNHAALLALLASGGLIDPP